jgi:hypothetical protein
MSSRTGSPIHMFVTIASIAFFMHVTSIHASAAVYDRTGNLKTWVLDWIKPEMLPDGGNRYRVPTAQDLDVWRQVVGYFYTGNLSAAADLVSMIAPYYRVVRYTDTSGNTPRLYYLLIEANMTPDDIQPVVDTGWPLVIFDPNPLRELTLESPHPLYDQYTDDDLTEGIVVLRPRLALLSTSHRCSSNAFSVMSGSTPACKDSTGFRLSDPPHAATSNTATNPLQVAHEELVKRYGTIVIQFHSKADTQCSEADMLLSNTGTPGGVAQNGNVIRLKQSLVANGFTIQLYGIDNTCALGGTGNLQGRFSNGSSNPVTQDAPPPKIETFIHIEQRNLGVRDTVTNRRRVLDAIAATSFVYPGTGQTIPMAISAYGWPDNSPPGAAIAYPQIHQQAGGTGTYNDPITFSTDPTELVPGTIVYAPVLRRYFINEDYCPSCVTDWQNQKRRVDVWVGGTPSSSTAAISACESAVSMASPDVIVDPPANMAVDAGPLFDTNTNRCYIGSRGQNITMVVTGYGWPDNSPPGPAIAYPQIHSQAGGTGSYVDPITFATDPTELAPGTIIYVPHVQRYFINEDWCGTCVNDWKTQKRHVDLWVGGSSSSPTSVIYACENAITRTDAQVIVNPPPNLTVMAGTIFSTNTNGCNTP